MKINLGKAECVDDIKSLYRQLGLIETFRDFESTCEDEIEGDIYVQSLDKIRRRDK